MKFMKKNNTKNLLKLGLFSLLLAIATLLPINSASASSYGSDWSLFSDDYSYGISPNYYSDYAADDYSYGISPNYYSNYAADDYSYGISPNYYSNYAYDYPSYDWGGYDYSYPSYSYGGYGGGYGGGYTYTPSAGFDYIYNTNANVNTNNNNNANTNTITNTFNPTNNNDARINLVVYGGGTGTTNTPANLEGNCIISPSVVNVNQDVTFSASASGGNGGYTYSWSGDNGLNSSSQSFTGRYSYPGTKTATVIIRSGSQSITRSCNVEVRDTNYGNIGTYCVANPTNAAINQNVTWTVYPYNNNYNYNGSYYGNTSYTWTGTDNLYGNGQTIVRSYNTPGYKTATVTGYINGQSFTTSCSTNIVGVQSNITVIRDQNLGTPVSGVFLSQVPDTGISFGFKMTLFTLGLVLWSIFAAYMIARKKGIKAADLPVEFMSKVNAFKLNNMKNKGII